MSLALTIEDVSARYGRTTVLDRLSLAVQPGEFVSLLGASGCGKTTTLRVVSGFLMPTGGAVRLGDRDIVNVPPNRRDIGLVFQTYALFPHMTVFDNVAFGLRQRRVSDADVERRVGEVLDRVGLSEFALRFPANLSGGQRQRVALARALVIDPSLLMFDEPLSNLDAKLRVGIRAEIRSLQLQSGTTAVYVTHDQEEAFSISDRVAIMDAGRIRQYDTPERLYRRPVDAFVARFVGFDTLIPLEVAARDGARVTATGLGGARVDLDADALGDIPDRFVLAARGDGLVPCPAGQAGIPGRVAFRTYLGRAYEYKVETPLGELIVDGPVDAPLDTGDSLSVAARPTNCCILPASPT